MTRRLRRGLPLVVLAVSLAITILGLLLTPILHRPAWTATGLRRLAVYCLVFLGLLLLRSAIARLWPSLRPGIAAYFGAVALMYGAAAIGVGPIAAITLFCVSATAVGGFFLSDSRDPGDLALCFCLGEGILGFAASVLGWTRLCYPATFLVLLSVPIGLRWRWLAARFGLLWRRVNRRDGTADTVVAMAALAFAAGIQYLLVLKPEVGTDSLAMHLALPAYVSIHHHWPHDVTEFIWALMPQTTDWCYAIAYSIGGEFAARLLNFCNLLAILSLLYGFIRRYCSKCAALAICALYATGPLVQVVTGSLFIENLLAALLFASCIAFCRRLEEGGARYFVAGWLCLGLALSCKTGAAAFVPGLLALALYSAWKRPLPWRIWAAALTCGLSIGLYSYAAAFVLTKNPLFPFANDIFHSKLMSPEPITVPFREPLTWRTPWDITFHSSRFIEGSDGCLGFQYLLLLPAGLTVMIWRRNPAALWMVVVGLSAAIFTYCQISYLRYLYPSLLLLMAPAAFWIEKQRQIGGFRKRLAYGIVATAGVLNLWFQPASGWYHRDFVWDQISDPEGRAEYLQAHAPARKLVNFLNRIAPREPALFCQYFHIAGFAGPAYSTNWHTYLRNRELLNCLEAVDVLRFVNERHIRYIVSPAPARLETWPRALPAFFADFAEPAFSSGDWFLYRVKPEFSGDQGLQAARELVKNPPVAGPGTYDDVDIRVVRNGYWFRNNLRTEPLYRTLTESSESGAEVSFAFRGRKIAYRFARDRHLGVAEIRLDGAIAATIDEYAPVAAFGQQQEFDCSAPGVHALSVSVTGRKNAASHGVAVVLDGFEVSQ